MYVILAAEYYYIVLLFHGKVRTPNIQQLFPHNDRSKLGFFPTDL